MTHFKPIILNNIFSETDANLLKNLIKNEVPDKDWLDGKKNRKVKKFSKLETYFSKKLEPLAKSIFSDQTLKTSYSVYLGYSGLTSNLPPHRDTNACTYTIDYCLSQKISWPLIIDGKEYHIPENGAVAFMGGFDEHSRGPMPEADVNFVENIMFHFCPDDHWYFTEGPQYIYDLKDRGLLDNFDGESYYLSPKREPKGDRLYL